MVRLFILTIYHILCVYQCWSIFSCYVIPFSLPLDLLDIVWHDPVTAFSQYPSQPHIIIDVYLVIILDNLLDTIRRIVITLATRCVPRVDQGKHFLCIDISECSSGVDLIIKLPIIAFVLANPPPVLISPTLVLISLPPDI